MNDKFTTAGKDVLVEIVKLAQKRKMEGEKGGWKEFLKGYDTLLGASMSDPARRTPQVLRAFLDTFKKGEDLKFFAKVMECHSNRELVKEQTNSTDVESPQERLVRLTLEHPQYPIEYSFPSFKEDWIVTKHRKKFKETRSSKLLAVDCEMVLCDDGNEALVKVCIVDENLEVILHEFVKPNRVVVDYRTQITGVSAEDLDGVTCSLADIQTKVKKIISRGSILVGHSLSNDLKALKIDHARVIDTSYVFKLGHDSTKRKPSLNDLCKFVLDYELRKKGDPHNCVDDACAAMKLVLAKIKHGFDKNMPVVQDDVPESENRKLLIHRIPEDLPSEELGQIIPGDFTIEIKAKKGHGGKYSAVATFKTLQEALSTYDKLQGVEEKDSSGRSQKPVSVQLKSGSTAIICVRKMTFDEPDVKVSTKRPYPTEIDVDDSKRLKTEKTPEAEHIVDHVKEIKRLNDLLSKRDEEIASLHKIVAALTRKQGL
ncbi:small RNA degrading nuclease 1 [Amaranthus tricolor]|uniref:small RNA degrading nuclease 1 n=1 Tax=Amaranthus tricolor TaxID=29722 RepID=UPI00258D0B42|nr:small RNA degrading nuclease 1 [Amaranthus tricolor]XP_057545277.1 small RNA degrading nuclease 1 [Amaranthus tricolor]